MRKDDLVAVAELIPDLIEDLRYATAENFTGAVLYSFRRAWLRRGTAEKLARAQAQLRKQGFRLKLWDAFRPLKAQYRMWEVCPNDDYVADPTRGGCSNHNRGSAVDVTLVALDGAPVAMPSDFDDFSGAARRDTPCNDPAARSNSRLLERVMSECGFQPYIGEWWHYADQDSYPLERDFCPPE